jgi:hypothetical protein
MRSDITLGIQVEDNRPLTVPRSAFGHMHVRGMTGSGKTSLGLIPLVEQFIEPGEDGAKDPIFVFDLGGDQNMFHNVRHFAENHPTPSLRRRFRYFALEAGLDTYFLPPFQAVPEGETDVVRIAQLLVQAFSLDFGLAYAASYFSQQNLGALLRVARKLADQNRATTLEDIRDYLDDPKNRREFKDADQVRMTFDFLFEYPQLADAPDAEREINVARALEESEVVYFFLPTLTQPVTGRHIAGLGLYTVVDAAIKRVRSRAERRNVRVFIDEGHEISGRSFAALLAQARKFFISIFFSHQSTSQLEGHDQSLADVVFEGTAVKQYYTCVGQKDIDVLQSLSKDTERELGGKTFARATSTTSVRSIIEPTLRRNTVLDVSAEFGKSFVVINDGARHREPIIVQQEHRYPNLSGESFPRVAEVGPQKAETPEEILERKERHERLSAFIAKRRAEEGGSA